MIATRPLGSTGIRVTELGLGGAGLHGAYGGPTPEGAAIACVRRAVELGITYIDTSAGYGTSEERIGKALDGIDRDRLFLATKTGTGVHPHDYSRDWTLRSVERSLERLRTDRLDLVQIHDPDDLAPAFQPDGALNALLDLKTQGIIGAIGLGVRSHVLLRQAIDHGAFDTILTYSDFNLARQTALDLIAHAAERSVAVILGSPLLYGYLTDRPWSDLMRERGERENDPDRARALVIRAWAAQRGLSVLRLAVQYCLREPRISTVLAGAASSEEIEQCIRAARDPVPEAVWAELGRDLGVR